MSNNTTIANLGGANGLAASGGSALVGFLQAGTGAVARTGQAKMRDFVNVKDFGAVGDGVTNDRAAINLAHAAHKKVYYPAGTYLVSGGSIDLPTGVNGIAMMGDGRSTKITSPFEYGAVRIYNHDNVVISDIWFESTAVAFGCITGFHSETSNVIIERCRFTTGGAILTNGIKFVMDLATVGLDGLIVRDCVFDSPGRMGVEIQNHGASTTVRYRNVTIENCKFLNTGLAVGGGTTAGMGLSFTGLGESCNVLFNEFDGCTGPSIENIGASHSNFIGNKIRRAKARPIQTANIYLMTGNVYSENIIWDIDATLGDGVYLGSTVKSIFSNNFFDLTGRSAKAVEITSAGQAGTGKNQFIGNTVIVNAAQALVIDSCPDNVINGNTLDNSLSGASTASVVVINATATRNAIFGNYTRKGTGGGQFQEVSGATGNFFADFYSLESGVVYVRNSQGGRSGFATYDPPSIAVGGSASTTVTVTGAAVQDYAQASLNVSTGGLTISAAVTAANTVTVTYTNNTAAAIDMGSHTILARSIPFTA